jgi:hypothetical protein
MIREQDHRRMDKSRTSAVVAFRLIPPNSGCVNGTLELNVGMYTNSGEGELEPDPVRTTYSVWQDVAIEYNDVVRRNVAVTVTDSIYTRIICFLTCFKTLCHGGFLFSLIFCHAQQSWLSHCLTTSNILNADSAHFDSGAYKRQQPGL